MSLDDLQFILGTIGTDLMKTINHIPKTKKEIQLITGCPMACINGRIPVLLELELIKMHGEDSYISTEKGDELKIVL